MSVQSLVLVWLYNELIYRETFEFKLNFFFIELLPIYNLFPYLGAMSKCVEGVDMWGEVIH